jgi:hypothetical protein
MGKSGIDIRTGATGYRHQLDRVRRYQARVLASERYRYLIDYQDDVWSFFQNCWHLKDWVKNDELRKQQRPDVWPRIKLAIEQSPVLAIANDMGSGTKHLALYDPRAGASYSHLSLATGGEEPRLECILEVNGEQVTARIIAQQCVAEWDRILRAEGLPTDPLGT